MVLRSHLVRGFSQGDFDQTDRIFGSGARVRDQRVTFVAASHSMDRLIWAEKDGLWYISNSLPGLLNCIGASVDATERGFQRQIGTIALGIDDYTRELPTSAGPVRFAYFHNVVWDGGKLAEQEKPDTIPPFNDFNGYRARRAIRCNSSRRIFPMRGEDSPSKCSGRCPPATTAPACRRSRAKRA